MPEKGHSVQAHFEGKSPAVRRVYERLLSAAGRLGPVEEDPKKTSIHLNRRTAFAGVATRKDALVLTLKSARDIPSSRIARRERLSANRWHLEVRLVNPKEIDREVVGWLRESYALSA